MEDSPQAAPAAQDDKEIKAAVSKVATPSGQDKDGKPDGSLSPKQVERAAVESLHALRPQPTANEIRFALARLAEVGEDGQPTQKFSDTDAVIGAAKSALDEGKKAA